MSFQNTKEEMMRRYRNSRLMQNYLDNKEKQQNPIGNVVGLGKNLYDGFKTISSTPQPSAEFMGKVGASLPQGASFSTSAGGIEGLGSTSLNTQTIPTNTIGQGASQAGQGMAQSAGSALGKAMPVVGTAMGGLSAANNFKNGNYTDGALDLAKTGAMFIPGVGWAVSGAIQIGQMIKNMFAKKQQEAMQKSKQENAKAQQEGMQNFADQQAKLEEGAQESMQNVLEQQQKQNEDAMAQGNIQPQELKQDIYNKVVTPQDGQVVGGASGVFGQLPDLNQQTTMPSNYAEESMPTMTPEELAYIEQSQQPQPVQMQPEEMKRSLMDKFRSGLSDFSAGYQDNTNSDFMHGDLMNNLAGGAAPVQNSNNSFGLGTEETKKSIMARLGEMAGTGQRVMSNPWTQAAIAGLVTKATGGDWADVANNAYSYGTNKAKSDYYQKQLNPNAKPSVLGTYDSKDYNAQTLANYRTTMNDINNAKIKAQLDQNFPLASDYYASQLASGQMSLDDYNKVVGDANYNPNQRISLKAIKTTSDSNYQKDKIDVENKKVDNNYELGKEKNSISKEKNQIGWTNASTNQKRLTETQRHNGVMEGQGQAKIDAKTKAAQEKAEAKKQAELDSAIQNGDVIMMVDPSGNKVPVGRRNYKEAIKRGYKKL